MRISVEYPASLKGSYRGASAINRDDANVEYDVNAYRLTELVRDIAISNCLVIREGTRRAGRREGERGVHTDHSRKPLSFGVSVLRFFGRGQGGRLATAYVRPRGIFGGSP